MTNLLKLEKILKKSAFYVAAAALFSAMIFLPNILRPFILGKMFPFQVFVLLLCVIWAILMLIDFQKYRPRFNLLTIAVSIFYFAILLSCIFSLLPYRSFWGNAERMEGFISLLHFYFFFLAIASIFRTDKDAVRSLIFTSICINFFGAIFPILELLRIIPLTVGESLSRPGGVFGNPTFFAGYLLVHLFLIVWYYLNFVQKSEHKEHKNLLIVMGIVSFIVFFWAQTRGSILGLGAGLFASLVLSIFLIPDKKYKKYSALASAIIVVLAILFIIFQPKIQQSALSQKVSFIGRLASISLSDASTRARILNWSRSFNWWKERPIFGHGQDMYYALFDSHYDANDYALSHERFDRAHNKFFDVLVMNGIVGLLAYLFLIGVVFYLIFKKIKKSEAIKEKISWLLIFGLFVAYLVHNFFVFDTPANSIFFYFFLGFISLSTQDIFEKKEKEIEKEKDVKISVKSELDGFDWLIILSVLLIASFIFYHVDFKPYKAAKLVYDANRVNPQDLETRFNVFQKAVDLNTFINTEIKKPWADYFYSYLLYSANGQIKTDKEKVVKAYDQIKNNLIEGYQHEPMIDLYTYLTYLAGQMSRQPFLSEEERSAYFNEAEKYVNFIIEKYPKRSDLILNFIFVEPTSEKAEEFLNGILTRTPKYAPAIWAKTIFLIKKNASEEEIYNSAVEAFENGYQYSLDNQGDMLSNAYNMLPALQNKQKIFEFIDKGIAEAEEKLKDKKLNAFERSLQFNKLTSLIDLAITIEISNPPKDTAHIEKVIAYLEKANQYQPNRVQILIKLAAAYAQLHNKEKAIDYAKKVVQVNPRYATDVVEFIQMVEQEQWDKLF